MRAVLNHHNWMLSTPWLCSPIPLTKEQHKLSSGAALQRHVRASWEDSCFTETSLSLLKGEMLYRDTFEPPEGRDALQRHVWASWGERTLSGHFTAVWWLTPLCMEFSACFHSNKYVLLLHRLPLRWRRDRVWGHTCTLSIAICSEWITEVRVVWGCYGKEQFSGQGQRPCNSNQLGSSSFFTEVIAGLAGAEVYTFGN